MDTFKILISEDNLSKFKAIKSCIDLYLNDLSINFSIHHESSINGTVKHLINDNNYDLLVQDMQMPKYEDGRGINNHAGAIIFRHMKHEEIIIESIICSSFDTQYIHSVLKEYHLGYIDSIEFSSVSSSWELLLIKKIDSILKNEKTKNNISLFVSESLIESKMTKLVLPDLVNEKCTYNIVDYRDLEGRKFKNKFRG